MRPQRGGKRSWRDGRKGRNPAKKSKRDPAVFKGRKYNRNMYQIEKPKKEESSEESSEEEQTEYNKLLQVFNKNGGSKDKTVTSESESDAENEDESDAENGVENDAEVEGSDAENGLESDIENGEDSDAEKGEESDAENEEGNDAEESDAKSDAEAEESDAEPVSDNNEEESDAELENDPDVVLQLSKEYQESNDQDPFTAHFEVNLSEDLTRIVKEQKYETSKTSFPCLGQVQVLTMNVPEKQLSPLEEAPSAREQLQQQLIKQVPTIKKDLKSLHIKPKILDNLEKSEEMKNIYETDLSLELLSAMSSYKDLLWTERNSKNKEEIRMAYSMHALNHALKGKLNMKKNNDKLKSGKIDEVRDQGLTRPTVLIVVPFSESARQIVKCMEKLIGKNTNSLKFNEKYPEPENQDTGFKPDDFYETFQGDSDDSFRLGIAVNPTHIRPFTVFDKSDIIVTSPLGLRLILGAEGEQTRIYDFINSIELLIMDEMEVFMMQNWQHILCLLDDIHRQPQNIGNTDFSRVRMWGLDGLNKYYRQTLLFSGTQFPEMNSIFNRNCHNYFGKIRVCNPVTLGAISTVFSEVPVVFQRINSSSHKLALEERFEALKKLIQLKFTKTEMDHVLIFFPDYIDFTKARNWFKNSDMDYASICEYTDKNRTDRKVRDDFYHNELHFLLYTERAHFFKRFTMKGIRHLIFYQMPLNPHFFNELCNFQQKEFQNKRGGSKYNMSCTVLYTKYDACRLIQSVGTEKAATMIKATNDRHIFAPQKS